MSAKNMAESSGETIEFRYGKSNFFRVVHADGAYGGITPQGNGIHLALFSERNPIPAKVTHALHDGILGEELSEERPAVVDREVEVSVMMSLQTAEGIANWLLEKVKQAIQDPGKRD